jgi:hypothetical protein
MEDDVIARTPAQIYQGMAGGKAKTPGRLTAVNPFYKQVTGAPYRKSGYLARFSRDVGYHA